MCGRVVCTRACLETSQVQRSSSGLCLYWFMRGQRKTETQSMFVLDQCIPQFKDTYKRIVCDTHTVDWCFIPVLQRLLQTGESESTIHSPYLYMPVKRPSEYPANMTYTDQQHCSIATTCSFRIKSHIAETSWICTTCYDGANNYQRIYYT